VSLDLDSRQRAMLEEMGIRLFWPDPQEEALDLPVSVAAPRAAAVAAPVWKLNSSLLATLPDLSALLTIK